MDVMDTQVHRDRREREVLRERQEAR